MSTRLETTIHEFVRETGGWAATQLEACTRCGICAGACHYLQATNNPEFAPVWKMEPLRKAYEQRFTLAGRLKAAVGADRPLTDDDLLRWSAIVYEACSLCNKCALVCPMGIQIGPLIHEVRAGLAAAGIVPTDLMAAVRKQLAEGSPLGVTDDVFDDRMEWIADEWEVELPFDREGAETLVVFTSIEIMKFPENVGAIAKILNAAGENWTISHKGREVVNFGAFEGNPATVKTIATKVIDAARELGVKKLIVTECGHAYDVLRWSIHNMLDLPPGLEVQHISGLIGEYVRAGKIKLREGYFDKLGVVTFHDACKIQRRGGHMEEPREVLRILAPSAFKEMQPNREQAFCCGGGGGVIAIKEADPNRYAAFELKIEQMKAVGAQAVAMTCANCRLQFTDSIGHFNLPVKALGLSAMVAEAMVEE